MDESAVAVDHQELPASGARQHAGSEHKRNTIASLPQAQQNLPVPDFAPPTASPSKSARPIELETI